MKLLIVNTRDIYQGKLDMFAALCPKSGIAVDCLSTPPKDMLEHVRRNNYDVVLHRNEHGRLFADSSIGWVKQLVKEKIPVLSLDFGYLDHYKTFMFDFYREDLSSSIHYDWRHMGAKVDWSKAPEYIQEYRNNVFAKVARADNSKYAKKVCIWLQWNARLLRPEVGKMSQAEWTNKVIQALRAGGYEPVVKHNLVVHSELYEQTVPKIDPTVEIISEREKVVGTSERIVYDKYANWNLVAGCDFHVILCSSVSHLMSLTKKPVIAMGQSWFNALGIFHEEVGFPAVIQKPKVNNSAREKWMNWWLSRQALIEDSPGVFLKVVEKAREYFKLPAGEQWKYEYIYSHPEEYKNYGSSMHGKKALQFISELQPATVVDIGCGANNFLTALKKQLPNVQTVGVDFASPLADIKASATSLPFADKSFDLLTAFDVLEHLQRHEIEMAFKEFQRVSKVGIFRIAKEDSRLEVKGQTLHPTVMPIEWWLLQLSPFISKHEMINDYVKVIWK